MSTFRQPWMTTYLKLHSRQMDVEYTWIIWQEKNCSQFRLLFPFSFNNQIIYPVWGKGAWGRGVRYLYSLRTLHLFTFFTSLPMTVYTNSSLIKKNVLTWRVSWDFPALQIYDCILRAEKIKVISLINLGHFFICGWPTTPPPHPFNCKIVKIS